jgi:hypothetical protein
LNHSLSLRLGPLQSEKEASCKRSYKLTFGEKPRFRSARWGQRSLEADRGHLLFSLHLKRLFNFVFQTPLDLTNQLKSMLNIGVQVQAPTVPVRPPLMSQPFPTNAAPGSYPVPLPGSYPVPLPGSYPVPVPGSYPMPMPGSYPRPNRPPPPFTQPPMAATAFIPLQVN